MSERLGLVVEDESDLRGLFTLILEEAGFKTTAVYSVSTALKVLEEQVPDIVTLDMKLPGGNGREVLRKIREDPRMIDTRVVVVTAFADEDEELHSKADLVLMKPVGVKQLRDLIGRLTGQMEK